MIWTHLFSMHPYLYPLKTSENLTGALETNGLKTWMKIIMLNAEAYLLQPSRTSTMRFYPTFTRQLFLQKAPSQVFDSVLNTPLKRSHLQQTNAMNTSRRAWNVLRGVKPCCQLSPCRETMLSTITVASIQWLQFTVLLQLIAYQSVYPQRVTDKQYR